MSEIFLKIKNQVNILNLIIAEEKELLEKNNYKGLESLVKKKVDSIEALKKLNESEQSSKISEDERAEVNSLLMETERANKVNALLVSGLLRVNKDAINKITGREEDESYSKSGSSYGGYKNKLGEA